MNISKIQLIAFLTIVLTALATATATDNDAVDIYKKGMLYFTIITVYKTC